MKLQRVVNENLHFILPVGVLSFMGFASVFLPWSVVLIIVAVGGAILYKKLDPRTNLPTDKTREEVTKELLEEEEKKEMSKKEKEESKQKKKEKKRQAKIEQERARRRKEQQQKEEEQEEEVEKMAKTPATSAGYSSEESGDDDDLMFLAQQQFGANEKLKKRYADKILNSSKQSSSDTNRTPQGKNKAKNQKNKKAKEES
eukprot:gb/GECG01011962.1/.p1 GENE.gb/GECG01011962.1/~~gb/GECG01011962.1/.p1  ORF type:complete len:201 (+),score=61.75 gb/GECG01011962.1/:1-603(+)